jgi:anti-anti-sigma regulatory factor
VTLVSRTVERRLVVQLDEVIDPDTAGDVERELRWLLRTADTELLVIDIRTPVLTSAALHLLMRVRRGARTQGTTLCVVARQPLARLVLRSTGLSRTLRASATMSGALALARSCPPPSPGEAGCCDAHREESIFRTVVPQPPRLRTAMTNSARVRAPGFPRLRAAGKNFLRPWTAGKNVPR